MNSSVTWEEAVRALIADPARQQLVRDCYYDRPALAAAERYRASEEWAAIAALLPRPAGRVLDLGAGHGITSFALARIGWQVTALEPDPSELVGRGAIRTLAAAEGLRIDVMEGAGESIPLPDAQFDVVFARAVLHHARDLGVLCREVARVLRPGGTFLAVREHVISRRAHLAHFHALHPLHRFYGGEHACLPGEYLVAMRCAGLRVVRVLLPFDSPINYAPWSRSGLRDELVARTRGMPGAAPLVAWLLGSEWRLNAALWLLSRLDRRPGRLYSFVCQRP